MAIKVLLVEDDRALREALADTLLLAGHDYRAVGSAEEALEAVEQESFSLVVSDVNMPGMDGHQLLGLLRARQPQLPVLLMTAPLAVLVRGDNRLKRAAWLFSAAYAGWYLLTYRPWRFLMPALPLAAMLGACASDSVARIKQYSVSR